MTSSKNAWWVHHDVIPAIVGIQKKANWDGLDPRIRGNDEVKGCSVGPWLAALVVCCASCGSSDFESAVQVTLTGTTAPQGGGYRVELRQPDGAAIAGVQNQEIAAASGNQVFSLVVKNKNVISGDRTDVRIYVEAHSSLNSAAAPLALGSAVVELRQGEVSDATVELAADPRPLAISATCTFGSEGSSFSGNTAMLELSGTLPSGLVPHGWLLIDGQRRWLGAFGAGTTLEATLPNASAFVLTSGVQCEISAEPGADTSTLARSNGWTVFRGQLFESYRTTLAPLFGAGSNLETMWGIIVGADNHTTLARGGFNGTNPTETRLHAEHVHNMVVGAGSDLDLDGSGTAEFGIGITTGIGVPLTTLVTDATLAAENSGDGVTRSTQLTQLQACRDNLLSANTAVANAASTLANDDTSAQVAANMVALETTVSNLTGVAFDAAGASTTQTAWCVQDRLESLTVFELSALAAGEQ